MHTQEFIAEMKGLLLEKKQQLTQELSGLHAHTEMGNDDEDVSYELPVDEVNQDLIVRLQKDLASIDAALARVESGTYGIDENGNEISEDRLRAIPWAEHGV